MNREFGEVNVLFRIFRRFRSVTDRNGGRKRVEFRLISLYLIISSVDLRLKIVSRLVVVDYDSKSTA